MFKGHLGINLGGLKRNVLLSVTDAADWLEQLPPPPREQALQLRVHT